MKKLTPLYDRVLLRQNKEQDKTKGGLFIPETAKEKPLEGEVLAVGPGKWNDKGERIPMTVEVGDVVLFAKYAGTEVKDLGEGLLLIREEDILGLVTQ